MGQNVTCTILCERRGEACCDMRCSLSLKGRLAHMFMMEYSPYSQCMKSSVTTARNQEVNEKLARKILCTEMSKFTQFFSGKQNGKELSLLCVTITRDRGDLLRQGTAPLHSTPSLLCAHFHELGNDYITTMSFLFPS